MAVYLAETELMPESTFWHSLRGLRKMRLLEFGEGKKTRLTELGMIFAQAIKENGGMENEK